jgi:hypothetical protein
MTKKIKALYLQIIFLTWSMVMGGSTYATDAGICDIRAALLGSAAQERDKGVSKQKVKQQLSKKLAGMGGYIDLVYGQMKNMSPKDVATFTKFSCSQE